MRKLSFYVLSLLLAVPTSAALVGVTAYAGRMQNNQEGQERKVLTVPGSRRRRIRSERRRRGARATYARGGKSAGRGGKRFGKNIAHGRPIRGGKEFGKGMGGFGKYTGKGVARSSKRAARATKHAVKP
jgi:hypothetical protein